MPSKHETMFRDTAVPMLNDHFGVSVYLSRGPMRTDALTARRGDREHEAIGQEYGLSISVSMRAFILPAALTLDDCTIEPRAGDRITEGDEVFEIQPPSENKPAVEFQAATGEWLVHTKRIQ